MDGNERGDDIGLIVNPPMGLGFIATVLWDLDSKSHIQCETHLSPLNNG